MDVNSNCHGYAFAEGKVIIDDGESLQKIIKEDAYRYLGKDKANSNEADVIAVYNENVTNISEDELSEGKIDAGAWYHSAKKEKNAKTYTDKDDILSKRRNINEKEVKEYNNKQDQSNLYYKKEKNKGGRRVQAKGVLDRGFIMVNDKELEKIIKSTKKPYIN